MSSFLAVTTLTTAGVLALLRFGPHLTSALSGNSRLLKQLQPLAEQFPFGVVIYGEDLRIRYANPYALHKYGHPLEAVIGQRDSDLLPPALADMFLAELHDAIGDDGLKPTETRFTTAGRQKMFTMTFTPFSDSKTGENEILSVWFEVTKVEELSSRLARLNRTLATMQAANRTLIDCQTEEDLLKRFCATLTGKAGYARAWIGAPTPDGCIRPVAATGYDLNDLEHSELHIDAESRYLKPVGRALRKNAPVVVRRDKLGKEDAPWDDITGGCDLSACAGFPIRIDGQIAYGLSLCAASPDAFDAEEMDLLKQLAADLGYGIASVRTRERSAREEMAGKGMLEIYQKASTLTEAELIGESLKLAREATHSQSAYLYLPHENHETVLLGEWPSPSDNRDARSEACAESGNLPKHPIALLRSNHPSLIQQPDAPDANPGSVRHASAPITDDREVQAVIGVGSAHVNYAPTDTRLLSLIGSSLWKMIHRKRATIELNHQKALLDHALRIAQLGTWEFDIPTAEIRWSNETYRIHAWPRDAAVTIDKVEQLIHPEDRQRVTEAVTAALQAGERLDLEYRLSLPSGGVRHIYVRGQLTTDSRGRNSGLTGTVLDITAKAEHEEKARNYENMLLRFLDNLPAVITLKTEALQHVYANTAALKVLGSTPDEFPGTSDTAFLRRDEADQMHSVERSVLRTRQPVHIPDLILENSGHHHLRGVCFPVVLPDGEVLVGMYATDVAELESANAKSTLLQTALESAANGVVITNVRGDIEWVNSAFSRITGYPAEEAVGQNPRILNSGTQDKQFYKDMWAKLLQGDVWQGELRNRRKDGTFYDDQMTITPVKDPSGIITHFIAIKSDVSDRNEMEQKLLRSQRMESIGLLAGGVAHDLNNILSPILMSVDLLKENDLDASSRNEIVETIRGNCERGSGIIRQVLTFARGVEGERVIVQLRHQVKEIAKMAKETFPKNINIRANIPSNLWTVLGDPTQLHQVLLNFCVNARDAMPNGGTLEFQADNIHLSQPRSFQDFEIPPGRYARLTVKDTGSGIPPDIFDRIFEPFFTTKEQGKGTGLGLPTVLGIVKSHKGLVELESNPGKGTAVSAWLPASESQLEAKTKPRSTPPRGHGERILIVDDELPIRQLTRTILERNDYHVEEAADGAEAVALFATRPADFALVLTDVMMPVMDGVALAHALHRIDDHVRIVGSSGFMGDTGHSDRLDELKQAGVASLLHKPYSPRDLLETIAAELNGDDPGI